MLREFALFGVALSPMALYVAITAVLFGICYLAIQLTGVVDRIWQPALFSVALFVILLAIVTIVMMSAEAPA